MKRILLTIVLLVGLLPAQSLKLLETKSRSSVEIFLNQVHGGEQFLAKAKGYIVFPNIISAGFIVGGEYGEGLMRVDGYSQAIYRLYSASIGFMAGFSSKSMIIAFFDDQAMQNFLHSDKWEVGVDGGITLIEWSVNKELGSLTYSKPIYAIVYDASGIMGGISLKGIKFTKAQIGR